MWEWIEFFYLAALIVGGLYATVIVICCILDD